MEWPAREPRSLANFTALLTAEPSPAPGSGNVNGQPSPREVWLVETSGTSEFYSNGLRILTDFLTHTGPRSFPVFPAGLSADPGAVEWRQSPVGIVYHTTESDLMPLEAANRTLIRRRERGLLEYVQRQKLYNFVIDRFGRAYRVVPEEEYAHHAGHSVWGDGKLVYINLNQSFIGVAFETQTGEAGPGKGAPETDVTAAQLHNAALLTALLRSRYGIPDGNCVGHDLVSINPGKMLIGYHTDWAGSFPYEVLDLSNKYTRILPSMAEFGFGYDSAFVKAVGRRLWPGIRLSEQQIERDAALRRVSFERYRRQLQERYRRTITPPRAAARAGSPAGRASVGRL